MKIPTVNVRGSSWCADLRGYGGGQRDSLDVDAAAPAIEVGMALQRRLEELRLCAAVGCPTLPGLTGGATFRDLVGSYLDGRDYATTGGASYVADCCRRIVADLGHFAVTDLAAPQGEAVLRSWRDRMWAAGLSNRTVNNHLHQFAAIWRWARTGGRRLVGETADLPTAIRQNQALSNPIFEFWTEADFRHFRAHLFDEAVRTGGLSRRCGGDAAGVADYIARRRLYLSLAFYTGAHVRDLDTWSADFLSVEMGRYERHNSKSARCVAPCWFDMPEQLQIDCAAELERRGGWRAGELVAGGPWRQSTRTLAKATARLFPDGDRAPFTFRIARRSTVRELTLRGWPTHEIAAVLGHVDGRMVETIYRRCSELGIVSPVRVPWRCGSGPRGGPTQTGRILPFAAKPA
jgi:hypothetical protein